jgi:bifunctional non-homologous end joining protein LigD
MAHPLPCACRTRLELDGEDFRALPLGDRKNRLARLLGKRRLGIVFSEHSDEDGALLFVHACRTGLEGVVSKKLSAHRVSV